MRAVATVTGRGGAEGGAAASLGGGDGACVWGAGDTLGASRGSRGAQHAESFCRLVLERRSRSGAVRRIKAAPLMTENDKAST